MDGMLQALREKITMPLSKIFSDSGVQIAAFSDLDALGAHPKKKKHLKSMHVKKVSRHVEAQ